MHPGPKSGTSFQNRLPQQEQQQLPVVFAHFQNALQTQSPRLISTSLRRTTMPSTAKPSPTTMSPTTRTCKTTKRTAPTITGTMTLQMGLCHFKSPLKGFVNRKTRCQRRFERCHQLPLIVISRILLKLSRLVGVIWAMMTLKMTHKISLSKSR